MDSMGIRKSPPSLELTIAVPDYGLNSYSVSDDGNGCNNNGDVRTLVLLDMNRPPAASGGEEESQMGSEEIVEEEDERDGRSQRSKKLRLSKEQYQLLEKTFRLNHTIEPRQREALGERLKLRPRQVEVWFQNRRARSKLKNTEMECEYLRQCFGKLAEENGRLRREVEELRATQLPHSAPALAAVCPGCGRVAAAQPAAGAWASTSSSTWPASSGSCQLQLCCPSMAL